MCPSRAADSELQRLPGALRVQPRQRQIGGEADIAGPHIGPRAGLEALARHRPALVEGRIPDRIHAVLVHLLLGQRERASNITLPVWLRIGAAAICTAPFGACRQAVGSGFGARWRPSKYRSACLRGRPSAALGQRSRQMIFSIEAADRLAPVGLPPSLHAL